MGVGFAIVGLRIEKLAARRIQESGQGELVRWGEMQFGLHVTIFWENTVLWGAVNVFHYPGSKI